MAKSTTLIVDMTTVITNGPNSATKARALAAASVIMDYPANTKNCLLKLDETTVLLAQVIVDTDAGDSANLALLQGVQACLLGTSSPSTQLVTDLATVVTNGPTAATITLATRAAGPIMGYPDNVRVCKRKLQEVNSLLSPIITDTDSTDSANLALLQNIQNALV